MKERLLTLSIIGISANIQASNNTLEEVLVTAEKRETRLQTTSIAASAYLDSEIQKQGATTLADLESRMPSVNFGAGNRSNRGELVVRGIGGYSRNIGIDARTGVYIDGVYIGRSSGFDLALSDAERLEVLRGPQGTLFGKNTVSGAINIVTAEPDENFSASIRASTGEFNETTLSGKMNAPISSTLFSSVQLQHHKSDGTVKNMTLDKDINGNDHTSGRLKVRYLPTDSLSLSFSFDALSENSDGTNGESLNDQFAPKEREVAHDGDEFEEREHWGAALKADYGLANGHNISSISAYRDISFAELNEEDYTPLDIAISKFDEDSEQFSQEFRFISAKNEKYDYVTGIYWLNQHISTARSSVGGDMFFNPNTSASTPSEIDVQSVSAYIHGHYRITQAFELTGGVRYTDEQKDLNYQLIDTTGLFLNIDKFEDSANFKEWLPKFGVNYHSENALTYASVSQGYTSGGWNADFITTLDNMSFKPEYVTSYELGHKLTALNDTLRINTALFQANFKDFQIFQFTQLDNGSSLLVLSNAGEATTKGLEIETAYLPTDSITLNFDFTYTDATFDQFKNGDAAGIDYSGNTLPYAPEFKAYFGAGHFYGFNSGELNTHLGLNYTDSYSTHASNIEPTFHIDEFHSVDLRVVFESNQSWGLTFWIKNLTDEEGLRFRDISFLGVERGTYHTPRTTGLSVSYSL